MLINYNGVVRDMTQNEVAEHERMMAEMLKPEPTAEERLSALEAAMLAMMGGGLSV